jgi:hypothetical protein
MHMDMVFANDSLENSYIFGITDLQKQVSTPNFDIALKHRVTVFRHPYDVCLKASDCVPAMPVISHRAGVLPRPGGV